MADTYANYAALAAAQQIGVDYRLLVRAPAGSRLAHIAIHGGGIEPGTTELADYLAASASKFYSFDAMLPSGNSIMHITSTNYDEPQALALVASCDYVVSWHGADGSDEITYVGGLDTEIAQRVVDALTAAGFTVGSAGPELDGTDPGNITNRGARSMGVQLELTLAQRQAFFSDFTRAGRDSGERTSEFYAYVAAIQTALIGLDLPNKASGTTALAQTAASPSRISSQLPGDYGIPALSPLTVDGMPLSALQDALRLGQSAQQGSSGGEHFWSSPPRPSGDRLREVYEFSLSSARPVNRLSFSLARFPQRAWVQYRDKDGIWYPIRQASSSAPVQLTIQDSLPSVIPAGLVDDTRLHPQHFGAGHWVQQMVDVTPVTASRFRVIMVRIPSGSAPRGVDGQPVPYSLGVKDAVVSYRASSASDLPWLPQQDAAHSVALASSQDLLGSQVDYLVRRTRAGNAGSIEGGVWRCAPQPVPNAVVNLYLDLRTPDGKPQVVDRLSLDPVTSGPTVNLYYAEEDLDNIQFTPSDQALSFPMVRPTADGVTTDSGGLLFPDGTTALDVDNRAMQFDPYGPFLLALTVNPQFTSDDNLTYTVVDNGVLTVNITAGVVQVSLGNRVVELAPVVFGYNAQIPVAVAYDGETLTVRTPWETRVQEHSHVVPGTPPVLLRLGGALSGVSPGGALRITSLFLAKGRAGDIAGIDAYWADPAGYGLNPGYGADPAAHTCANAILRMDPSLITAGQDSVCPWGLIGGPGVSHQDLVWTPVNGDFTVRKGLLKFKPVYARYLNLEFTNLQPVPIAPGQTSPLVDVQLFPSVTVQGGSTVATASQTTSGAAPGAAMIAVDQGMPYQYADAARISTAAPTTSSSAYLPTEALYAPDPLDAQNLRRSQSNFSYMPLPGSTAPRFSSTGVHRYHVVQVAMDAKTAYSVALNQVLAYQSNPVAEKDTEQYIELFHTPDFLYGYSDGDPDGWQHTSTGMTTPSQVRWTGAGLSSKTMISRRRVLGVQIATQQSDPAQLVKDPDFDDPSLHYWQPVGDASIAPDDRYASSIGQMARVTRGHSQSSWSALETLYPTWDDVDASNPLPYRPSWSELEGSTATSDSGGIQSLHGVTPAPAGRLYAAARVYTESALAQPLLLQLINGDGRILAEAAADVKAAQVTEWYVDTTVHTLNPSGHPSWASVADNGTGGTRSWDDMETLGSWGDLTQDFDVSGVYDVRVSVVQQGKDGTGQWLVDSLVIYNDPILWEVSRDGGRTWYEVLDVRNNPRGVFTFPDLPVNDRSGGTQLRWKATGYTSGVTLSSVVLRPWYATLSGAVPYQDTLQASGSATSLADYYPPVDQDPYFQGWNSPIPQEWWLVSRKWQQLTNPATGPLPAITLPDSIAAGTNEGAPPSPAQHILPDVIVIP